MKKIEVKKLSLTIFLWIVLAIILLTIIAIFISGPAIKNRLDTEKVETRISKEHKGCLITRNSFKYVSYTCENDKQFIVFDANGKEIGMRYKKDARFDEVNTILLDYPSLKNHPIQVTFGYDSVVYMIENGAEFLVIDFDTMKIVMYSGG